MGHFCGGVNVGGSVRVCGVFVGGLVWVLVGWELGVRGGVDVGGSGWICGVLVGGLVWVLVWGVVVGVSVGHWWDVDGALMGCCRSIIETTMSTINRRVTFHYDR